MSSAVRSKFPGIKAGGGDHLAEYGTDIGALTRLEVMYLFTLTYSESIFYYNFLTGFKILVQT